MRAERANARMDVDEFIAWAIDRPGAMNWRTGECSQWRLNVQLTRS